MEWVHFKPDKQDQESPSPTKADRKDPPTYIALRRASSIGYNLAADMVTLSLLAAQAFVIK